MALIVTWGAIETWLEFFTQCNSEGTNGRKNGGTSIFSHCDGDFSYVQIFERERRKRWREEKGKKWKWGGENMFFTLSRSPLYLQSEKRVHSLLARSVTPDAAMISLMGKNSIAFLLCGGFLKWRPQVFFGIVDLPPVSNIWILLVRKFGVFLLRWRYWCKTECVDANSRRGATKKRKISRNLFSINVQSWV